MGEALGETKQVATLRVEEAGDEEAKASELLGLREGPWEGLELVEPELPEFAVFDGISEFHTEGEMKVEEDEPGVEEAEVETTGSEASKGREGNKEESEAEEASVYVGNVDYGATPQELQDHFRSCGKITRVTLIVDKYTGHPKGHAYVEFETTDAAANAIALSESTFRGRVLKVSLKRKNIPGFNSRGRGRGRGTRGTRGCYMPIGMGMGIPMGFMGPRGRGGFVYIPPGFGAPGYVPFRRGRGRSGRWRGPY